VVIDNLDVASIARISVEADAAPVVDPDGAARRPAWFMM
jgi:hypothetical protein